jgi:hypothetical protein
MVQCEAFPDISWDMTPGCGRSGNRSRSGVRRAHRSRLRESNIGAIWGRSGGKLDRRSLIAADAVLQIAGRLLSVAPGNLLLEPGTYAVAILLELALDPLPV